MREGRAPAGPLHSFADSLEKEPGARVAPNPLLERGRAAREAEAERARLVNDYIDQATTTAFDLEILAERLAACANQSKVMMDGGTKTKVLSTAEAIRGLAHLAASMLSRGDDLEDLLAEVVLSQIAADDQELGGIRVKVKSLLEGMCDEQDRSDNDKTPVVQMKW